MLCGNHAQIVESEKPTVVLKTVQRKKPVIQEGIIVAEKAGEEEFGGVHPLGKFASGRLASEPPEMRFVE